MNYTERNDVISMKKVKSIRSSIYDIQNIEKSQMKCQKRSSCWISSKRKTSFALTRWISRLYNEAIDLYRRVFVQRVYWLTFSNVRFNWSIWSISCKSKKKLFLMYFFCIHVERLVFKSISRIFINLTDYLFCTTIKQDWFNVEKFYDWLLHQLLFFCNFFFASRNVIIMNNVTIHTNFRIKKIIEQYDCQVRYFFSYFSDFNSIELSFSVLKVWIRQHFHEIWSDYDDDFENFLKYAVRKNQCDRFSKKHFKHTMYDRFIFEIDMQNFNARLTTQEFDINFE